jgi:glutaredoxin
MIKLYTTETCPLCKVLKVKLNSASIKYELHQDIEELQKKGITNVPILEIDDKQYNFSEAIKMIQEGQLAE